MEEEKTEKFLYTVGEVAKQLNVNESRIRYWSNHFDVIKPKRNARGVRRFKKEDIKIFNEIKRLSEKGLKLKAIQSRIQVKNYSFAKTDLIKKLEQVRDNLLMLKDDIKKYESSY